MWGLTLFIFYICMQTAQDPLFSPSLQLLEIDPEKRLKLRDLWEHPYFNTT